LVLDYSAAGNALMDGLARLGPWRINGLETLYLLIRLPSVDK
jgi:hypothetical protein